MDITKLHSIEFPNGGSRVELVLPEGLVYTPVNYIEATGTQYIDLGVKANNTLDMLARFEITGENTTNMALIGGRSSNASPSDDGFTFFLYRTTNSKFRYDWFGNNNSIDVEWAVNRMYHLNIKRRYCGLYYGSQNGGGGNICHGKTHHRCE